MFCRRPARTLFVWPIISGSPNLGGDGRLWSAPKLKLKIPEGLWQSG